MSVDPALQHVRVKDLSVAYRRAGSGPPIFLQHGGAGSGVYWRDVVPLLATDFDVVVWDMIGYGGSEPPPSEFSFKPPEVAEYLIGLMDALGIEQAALAGQSAGGLVSACAAAAHPDRVRKLVLLTVPNVTPRPTYVHKMAEELTGPDGVTRMTLDFMRRNINPNATQAQVDEWNDERLIPAGTSFARVVAALRDFDTLSVARRIQTPTLVIWGTKTSHRPPTDATVLAEALPNSRLVVIEGAEVVVPMDAAERVSQEISAFMQE